MKKLVKLYAVVLLALCSCSDPYEGSTYQVYDVNPISTYLNNNPERFSEWVEVLHYADLYNAINQASEYFTAFVPDNNAVQEFYKRKNVNSIEGLGKEFATELVKFHIIKDTINYAELMDIGEGKINKITLSEDYLNINYGDGGTVYLNKESRIMGYPIEAANGYIYVMEDVLNPIVESAYEKFLENASQYTLFNEILEMTSWSDSLDLIYNSIRQPNGTTRLQKRNFTVLAVPDQSFRSSGINSVSELISVLKEGEDGTDYKNPDNKLFVYTAYHIINGNYNVDELKKFNTAEPKKLMSTLSGRVIQITQEEDNQYYINLEGGTEVGPEVVAQLLEETSNVQAKNGIIHQVDAYMPVWETKTPLEIKWDFVNHPDVETYINNYGKEGQIYQTINGSNEFLTEISSISSLFNWYAPEPSSWTGSAEMNGASRARIIYHTSKNSGDWQNNLNQDHMILNLGTNGWVEMETPAVVVGKYKVTLYYCFATSMEFIRAQTGGSNGGLMTFSFDDDPAFTTEGKPFTTVPAASNGKYNLGNYPWVMFNEIEFPKTGTHKFKILLQDPVAGTNSNYRMGFDYLHFEPIIEEE